MKTIEDTVSYISLKSLLCIQIKLPIKIVNFGCQSFYFVSSSMEKALVVVWSRISDVYV